MRKTISILLLVCILPGGLFAGFHFGIINAAKKKVEKVDEKVELKQNEILARQAPTLSWTGEANYVSDGVNPEAATASTPFDFRVAYKNPDNYAPASGYPKVHIKKGGVEIPGSPFAMTYVSGAYTNGAIYSHSTSLVFGSDYSYYFEAKNINNQDAAGAPLSAINAPAVRVAPTLAWTGEATYIADGLNPEAGFSTDTFNYRIKYSDSDGDAPASDYPKVHIKKGGIEISGSPFAMAYVSGAYSSGAIYSYSGTLPQGNDYAYYFETRDSYNIPALETSPISAPNIANSSPTLSWTGETNYTADGLTPEAGTTGTTFIYRVKYTDPDNDAPLSGYPKLHIKKAGTEISGSPFTMSLASGAPATGSIYTYFKVLTSTGTDYTYSFEAQDLLSASAIGEPIIEIAGPNVVNWSSISAGSFHTLAVKTDGTLWAWGSNGAGQLGLGDTTDRNTPTQVGVVTNWSSVSAGRSHTVAVKTDGTLWAWGYNGYGELGFGDTANRNTPTQVGVATNWSSVSASEYHTLAVKTDGTLWAWGWNLIGGLGLGDTTDRNTPTQVGVAINWSSVSAGAYHTIAMKTDGTLWAWGPGGYGQLGLGDWTNKYTPTQVGVATNWSFVSAGYYYTIAMKIDGTLWAWGNNNYGQLGLGDTTNKNTPTQVGVATNWYSIFAGGEHTIAMKTDGTLWAWGSNGAGRLGLGDTTNRYTPTQVGVATNWSSISASDGHTSTVKTDGTLWAWGWNYYGQLGLGDTTDRNIPTQVGN